MAWLHQHSDFFSRSTSKTFIFLPRCTSSLDLKARVNQNNSELPIVLSPLIKWQPPQHDSATTMPHSYVQRYQPVPKASAGFRLTTSHFPHKIQGVFLVSSRCFLATMHLCLEIQRIEEVDGKYRTQPVRFYLQFFQSFETFVCINL